MKLQLNQLKAIVTARSRHVSKMAATEIGAVCFVLSRFLSPFFRLFSFTNRMQKEKKEAKLSSSSCPSSTRVENLLKIETEK